MLCASIGEVGYVLNLTANVLARGILVPERNTEEGWVPTTEPALLRATKNLISPGSDQSELIRRMSLIAQIAGEGWLVGTNVYDEIHRPAGIVWEFLSTSEIKVDKEKVTRRPQGYGQSQELSSNTLIARYLHSDAQYSDLADSPIKTLMPILREIVLLTQVVDAIAKSRLSAGIFFIPEEISSVGQSNEWEDPNNPATGDEFEDVFIRQITAPVEDRSDAASLVPLIMTGPADLFGKMGLIETARGLDNLYADMRAEALRRLSSGLSIPPEILQGKGGLNHWTGYNIDQEFLTRHVEPLADSLTDFLSQAYLRVMLVGYEGFTYAEAQDYRFRMDLSKAQSRVNAGDTARQIYNLKGISLEALLRENGLDLGDAPSEEETQRRVLMDMLTANPGYAKVLLPQLFPDLAHIAALLPDPVAPGAGSSQPGGRPTGDRPSEAEGGPTIPTAKGGTGASVDPAVADDTSLVERLASAASEELDRALERASNRLLQKLQASNRTKAQELSDVTDKTKVLTVAGEKVISTTGMSISDLFSGAWDRLIDTGAVWIQVYLEDNEVPPLIAEEQARLAMIELAGNLTFLASSAIRREIPREDNGLKVSEDLVRQALQSTAKVQEFDIW